MERSFKSFEMKAVLTTILFFRTTSGSVTTTKSPSESKQTTPWRRTWPGSWSGPLTRTTSEDTATARNSSSSERSTTSCSSTQALTERPLESTTGSGFMFWLVPPYLSFSCVRSTKCFKNFYSKSESTLLE